MLFDVLIASLLVFYFVPMADAWDQAHPDAVAISLLNIFLGWTCVGWIAALVWARTESPVDFFVARDAAFLAWKDKQSSRRAA
jgi:hypothetical protein